MAPARTTATPRLTERLTVPWWWWPLGGALAALAAGEIGLGAPGPRGWAPFAVLLPLTAALLLWFSRLRLRVADNESGPEFEITFGNDRAHLPLSAIREVVALDASGRADLLGPYADPDAFVVLRPWIGTAVQIVLDDPADPTPYWLVSTRRPVKLAEALRERLSAKTA
ncbi:MAG: DUF3093 domain-containing protein [Hamadaea sp.]|uniref:DUF3093 domain-containing protein n=1 Tax=Hamadaea sp. TaxID=2024425 RepID=UPI0018223669|nr:DUF3093 domain-containing protein [Hamadaea sp.]NUR72498.1 DUF3093 domain-containing protein [Hamadaea sp.]NUT19678.1 DUF3093 domain-containing protein [Hamadaea sp.]